MKTSNTNHPVKGSKTTVEPIRSEKDIKRIMRKLKTKENKRDYLLFVMGINNGLRIGDLLRVKVGDVRDLNIGETFSFYEQKTGKKNILMINKAIHEAIRLHLPDDLDVEEDNYLFKSRKGGALSRESVAKMIKIWTAGMKGNYSTHSLRKTWGYHQRTRFGVSYEIIMKRFNHSSPAVTVKYLGIEDQEVNEVLLNEIC